MIYKKIFDLRGTPLQQQIVIDAIDKIKFPWERLTPPKGVFVLGWADLNGQTIKQAAARAHIGNHPATDTDNEPIKGLIEGREYVLGVMYPSSGNIYIDSYLTNYPDAAQATVSAEIAHDADYYLPLTDKMREEITLLMHNNDPTPHNHSWWEKHDYGAEYYSLIGEAFMQAFTVAYSDIDFPKGSFVHSITKEQAPALRKIIGIERSDFVAPAVIPDPTPAPGPTMFYKYFGTSKIYHKASHYPNKQGVVITSLNPVLGVMTPCKTCKP